MSLVKIEGFNTGIGQGFKIDHELGRGNFGVVHLITDQNRKYALKRFSAKVLKEGFESDEAQIMMQLQHPNIVKLHEHGIISGQHYLVMDYMPGGSLHIRLKNNDLKKSIVQLYFYQMCKAVKFLHEKNIIHRDLKPDNMLLASFDDETLLKVCDFGLSKNYNYYIYPSSKMYAAPEVLSYKRYGKESDMWSLGVVLYECFFKQVPFTKEKAIKQGNTESILSSLGDDFLDVKTLLESLFQLDYNKRLNAVQVFDSEFLDDTGLFNQVEVLRRKYPVTPF